MNSTENKNLIYGISDSPKTVREWILYATQQCLAVFVATVLIAMICGTPVDACLFGACVGTLVYQVITKFKSPMFISSCGATCSAVIGALAIGDGNNYLLVAVGGLVICAVYALFAFIVQRFGEHTLTKIFPPIIVGSVTLVIGLNLATFIPTYVQVNGEHNDAGVAIAIATMLVIAIASHYLKGFWKTIPFLIGIVFGYIVSAVLTLTGVCQIIDFTKFANIGIFRLPDFSFMHWSAEALTVGNIFRVIVLFVPVAICGLLEHYSDHKVLSNIIGTDLTVEPGLHRTLLGDGVASFFGTIVCGLPNTSYGESIATTGFSRVASTRVLTVTACMLGSMAFIEPIQVFINTIPSCVFGGCAMILYGYIAASGLKTIINSKIDMEDNKNLIIFSVIMTVGVSGVYFLSSSFAGVSLAMVSGVLVNILLKSKKEKTK